MTNFVQIQNLQVLQFVHFKNSWLAINLELEHSNFNPNSKSKINYYLARCLRFRGIGGEI